MISSIQARINAKEAIKKLQEEKKLKKQSKLEEKSEISSEVTENLKDKFSKKLKKLQNERKTESAKLLIETSNEFEITVVNFTKDKLLTAKKLGEITEIDKQNKSFKFKVIMNKLTEKTCGKLGIMIHGFKISEANKINQLTSDYKFMSSYTFPHEIILIFPNEYYNFIYKFMDKEEEIQKPVIKPQSTAESSWINYSVKPDIDSREEYMKDSDNEESFSIL